MTQSIIINLTTQELKELVADTVRSELKRSSQSGLKSGDVDVKFYTRKEAAQMLRISLPTLLEKTKKGEIEGRKLGGRVLYSKMAIEKALKKMYDKTNKEQ